MMWLIKLADNWADEMDIEGFAIMSSQDFTQWAQTVEAVSKKIDSGSCFEWYIGENKWFDWWEGKEFKEAFSCEVITDEEADVLKRLLLKRYDKYGLFPSGEDMIYFLEDDK